MAEIEENKTIPQPQPKWRERLHTRYPDRAFETDEDWDNAAEEAFAEDEAKMGEYAENDRLINECISADKDLSVIISKMIVDKVPFRIAADGYLTAPKPGDDDWDYYQKSHEERLELGRQLQEQGREKIKNEAETYKAIDTYCESKGYDDTAKDEFIAFINEFYNSLSMKKISIEMLETLDNARTHDKDVKEAFEDGLIEGRNENIEAKQEKETAAQAGDGIPHFSGAGETPDEDKKPRRSFFADIKPTIKY